MSSGRMEFWGVKNVKTGKWLLLAGGTIFWTEHYPVACAQLEDLRSKVFPESEACFWVVNELPDSPIYQIVPKEAA